MDAWLLKFIQDNLITIGVILAILKEIAIETPWAVDDKIIQILSEFRNRKK
jgi:hypothetical protein